MPPACGMILKLEGTEYKRVTPDGAAAYDCEEEFVAKVDTPAVEAAKLDENRAASDLASAQAATTRLQNEQKKYAEVPRVLDQLAATTTAREIGTSTEILWSPYYQIGRAHV